VNTRTPRNSNQNTTHINDVYITNGVSVESDWLTKVDTWLVVHGKQTQPSIGQNPCAAIGWFRSVFDAKPKALDERNNSLYRWQNLVYA